MKGSAEYAKRLGALLRKIRTAHPGESYAAEDPIGQLIYGFLHWNVPRRTADAAMARIHRDMVDFNDLRVSHTHEIVALLGDRYPTVYERAIRLRETLHEVFKREHTLSLHKLSNRPKKEIRLYLEQLPGIAPFVAAHVSLVVFTGHAVPVDDRLVTLLKEEKVVNPSFTLAQVIGYLERNIRADDAAETHAALTAWVDAGTGRATLSRTTRKATRSPVTKTKATTTKRSSKSRK